MNTEIAIAEAHTETRNLGAPQLPQQSTLIAHRGTKVITRSQLANVPTPTATETWRPVPHLALVENLADQFGQQGVAVTAERLAVSRNGQLLFGVFDLSLPGPEGDFHAAFGFRSSNDKSLAIRAVAGLRVLVCSNLAMGGTEIVLKRRHTSGLHVVDEAAQAVQRFGDRYQALVGQVDAMKQRAITDHQAKEVLYDVFAGRMLPLRLLPAAHKEWFEPRHREFANQANLWRVHNALTEVAKALPPASQMTSLTRIGRLFSHLLN